MPLHESDIVTREKWFFGGVDADGVAAAAPLRRRARHWYDALITLVYTSHFLATPVLAAVLWLRDRTRGCATSPG